jgi:hypothetical protein
VRGGEFGDRHPSRVAAAEIPHDNTPSTPIRERLKGAVGRCTLRLLPDHPSY